MLAILVSLELPSAVAPILSTVSAAPEPRYRMFYQVIEKYFVAAGFAFVHADSTTDVCAVEAVKIEELDPEAVRAGLTEYTAKLASLQARIPPCTRLGYIHAAWEKTG